MADMPDLGKKLGPLPAGAWAVIVVAGLGIGYFINKRSAKNNGPTAEQLTESGVGTGGGSFLDINPPAPTPTPEETNVSWGKKVTNWLIANQYDPTVADNTVRKYLNGINLTIAENAIMKIALDKFGVPPEPLPPIDVPDEPTPEPTPIMPGPVTNVKTLNIQRDSVTLDWTKADNATSYKIRISNQWGNWEYTAIAAPWTWLVTYASGGGKPVIFSVYGVNGYGEGTPGRVTLTGKEGETHDTTPSAPPNPTPPANPPAPKTYTVVAGDTLTAISARFYGTASRYVNIYNANAGVIEAAAKAHGKSSSRGPNGTVGWWIYAGTVLSIP